MNRCKKICLSVLATALCFAMLMILPMVTKANSQATIKVSDAAACAGEEVDVTISLKNNPGIVSMALKVEYDTSVLTLKEVKDTGVLPGATHSPGMNLYPYILTWDNDSAASDYTVNGELVTLTFTVADDISSKKVVDINVTYNNDDYDIYNYDLDTVDFAVDNGSVTIDKMPNATKLANKAVSIPYIGVEQSGDAPTCKLSAYEDYLFAGWFTDEACTIENAIESASEVTAESYAKFIPDSVLQVKAQVATGDSNVMRFITSVDSLAYAGVGFEVTPEGGTKKTYQTTTVYERISSTTSGVEYGFSSKVIDTASNYLVTAKLNAEQDKDYAVRAFVVTMDGQKVYGPSRVVAVEDGKSTTTLNVSYKSENAPTVGSQVSVTYGSANTATTATVLAVDGKNVSARINVNASTLPSATKFIFGSTGSTIYRNLYTKYTGTGTHDTTWYSVYLAENANETEFTIATNADMYGFMELYAGKNLFKNKTLYVISDIAMNDNVTKTTVESWANGTAAPYKWNPSGDDNTGTRFQGTFDGQMHTLSGFYVNENNANYANDKCAGTYVGMFGSIDLGGVVKNFYLTDSYMTTSGGTLSKGTATASAMYAYLGSVAGENRGTIANVYSDAILASNAQRVGGIVGVQNTTKDVAAAGLQAIVDNCWFDGEVRLTGTNGKVGGGIIGLIMQRKSTIKNVLFTGKVSTTATGSVALGGIVGGNSGQTGDLANKIHMEDCVSTGTVTAVEGATAVGVSLGNASGDQTQYYMVNVYSDSTKGSFVGAGTPTSSGLAMTKDSLSGTSAYTNTLLDFENTWVVKAGETPVLKLFDAKYNASEMIKDFSSVKQNNWYNTNVKYYGIHTASGLNGFSDISQTQQFSGKTVYLSKDIDLNPGWVAPTDATTQVSGAETFSPIGRKKHDGTGSGFRGTFDGRNNEIRGLYINVSSGNQVALFAEIDANAVVKNFAVTNSYVYGTAAWNAGVVGICYVAKIENVYCDATIVVGTSGEQIGGIVGRCEGTVSGCWFNGKIYHTKTAAGDVRMGGIVGCTYSGVKNAAPERTLTIKDCLYTGTITYRIATDNTSSNSGVGGILGKDAMRNISVTMTNCVSAGTINCNVLKGTGSIMGQINSTGYNNVMSTVSMTNCYGAKDCVPGRTDRELIQSVPSAIANNVTQTDCALLNTSDLQGASIYDNANIKLDYTKWIARSNGSVVPTYFVDWIVPASETIAKPAN